MYRTAYLVPPKCGKLTKRPATRCMYTCKRIFVCRCSYWYMCVYMFNYLYTARVGTSTQQRVHSCKVRSSWHCYSTQQVHEILVHLPTMTACTWSRKLMAKVAIAYATTFNRVADYLSKKSRALSTTAHYIDLRCIYQTHCSLPGSRFWRK